MIPDLSVLWVICFVLLLTVIVQQLLFRPLLRVIHDRQNAIVKARELAAEAERRAAAANEEYEAQFTSAKNELYRQMDVTRRQALEKRSELLALTRQEADEARADALNRLRSTTASAREALSAEADALSRVIADRVLER